MTCTQRMGCNERVSRCGKTTLRMVSWMRVGKGSHVLSRLAVPFSLRAFGTGAESEQYTHQIIMKTILRPFIIKCLRNRGGKHLVPVSCQEVIDTPDDPVMNYLPVGDATKSIPEPVKKRLIQHSDYHELPCGVRIGRRQYIGKTVNTPRPKWAYVKVYAHVPEYVQFTKRTNEPKLGWLINECRQQGLRVERQGDSYHAPITVVHRDDESKALSILIPIDDLPDDAPQFAS